MNKSDLGKFLVRTNAFAPFRYLNRSKLPVLVYHRFSREPEFGKTSAEVLEGQLTYLKKHYRVLSLSEAVRFLREELTVPENSVVITIDDGYRDFFDVAFPVFRKLNVPSTIYVATGFVDKACWIWTDKARFALLQSRFDAVNFRVGEAEINLNLNGRESRLRAAGKLNSVLKRMSDSEKEAGLDELARTLQVQIPSAPPDEFSSLSWENAREMVMNGVEIGSHTVTHPILTNVDSERLAVELRESHAAIRNNLQNDRIHFCYPNGNVSGRERDAVAAADYDSAVTTEIRLCEKGDDLFLIPRVDAEDEMHRFIQSTSGFDEFKKLVR